jgi:two-component system phosphate regulon sensor histidine kinase PhoR
MRRKKLLWKIYPLYLVIILSSIIIVGIYASSTLKKFYLRKTAEDLAVRAHLIAREVSATFDKENQQSLDALCKTVGRETATRITLIHRSGEVWGDSEEDPRKMENHAGRPEVKAAFLGNRGVSTRYSDTLQQEMMYVALPLEKDGEIVGVVRTSIPVSEIDATLGSIYWKIALAGLCLIVLAAAASLYVVRRISQPIEEMKRGAQRFADGNFSRKLLVPDSEELGSLADVLNHMAGQLDEKIRMITQQRNELETILSAMREGVLAVDSDERILTFNQAAGSFLGIDLSSTKGYAIQEVVRNADILRFLSRVLTGDGPIEGEIVLHGPENKFLQLNGTLLQDIAGNKIGALVVLNDITRLRQLENIRREFVANVSHELKTPVTSIKGYVETLQEGALDDKDNVQKFLDIVLKQSDHLNAIVDDLLSLSRIEQDAESGEVQLTEENLGRILEAAVVDYELKAREREIKLMVNYGEEVMVKANSRLLKQAIGNLLDNAIKYSEPGKAVEVEATGNTDEVVIRVSDHGNGIAPEHLPRLFERFYRVDKGRSRELGGTGLGLAIVKHITQAHGGHVTVESSLGKGSIFTLHLPKA